MSNYSMILTKVGLAKVTNAQLTNENVLITHFVVGDGNGANYVPTQEMVALKNEKWRGAVSSVEIDKDNPHWIIVTGAIPAKDGGFMIREAGLIDKDGDLVAIGNTPETYKPLQTEGAAKDLILKQYIEVSNAANVTLQIDPTVIIASRDYVDKKVGKTEMELTDARGGFVNLRERLDTEFGEVNTQVNNNTKEALHTSQKATLALGTTDDDVILVYNSQNKIVNVNGNNQQAKLTYLANGALDTVTETIAVDIVVTKMIYDKNGMLSGVTKKVTGKADTFYPSTLVASIDNYLVNFVDGKLYLSRDAGVTYTSYVDVPFDKIKFVHVFSNGHILVCTHAKAYYSDWTTLKDSTVLDINGSAYKPTTYDNFTMYKHMDERQVVDGKEMLCWGNYSIASGTEYENARIWYTTDFGKTIKTAYKFRPRSDTTNTELMTRHIHAVNFNPKDNTFWAMTGDEPYCYLMRGTYNTTLDSWVWEIIGNHTGFKWSKIYFIGEDIYFVRDLPGTRGGLFTCKYADIADMSKHVQLKYLKGDAINAIISRKGDILMTHSIYGATVSPRFMEYSPDFGKTWHTIEGALPPNYNFDDAMFYGTWGANAQGKILSGVWSQSNESIENFDCIPCVFLDDAIRAAGFTEAFKK